MKKWERFLVLGTCVLVVVYLITTWIIPVAQQINVAWQQSRVDAAERRAMDLLHGNAAEPTPAVITDVSRWFGGRRVTVTLYEQVVDLDKRELQVEEREGVVFYLPQDREESLSRGQLVYLSYWDARGVPEWNKARPSTKWESYVDFLPTSDAINN